MSVDAGHAPAQPGHERNELVRTARVTGVFYLGLAIAGALGFLIIRPPLFVEGDLSGPLANLAEYQAIAPVDVVIELLVVLTQTLAAAWFYRLFRTVDSFAAAGIAVFGLVNAVAILVSAAMLGTATELATRSAETLVLLYAISGNMWNVGALFFGLWLIPMGWCVIRSGWMPGPLGWILIIGGVGYTLSVFARFLIPGTPAVADLLTYPASAGEFWMIGYLLIRGVRRGVTGGALSSPAGGAASPADPVASG